MSNSNTTPSNPHPQFPFVTHTQFLKLIYTIFILSLPLIIFAQEKTQPEPFIDENNSFYNGSARYTVPIEVPPGTNGLQPNLALVYNSQDRWGRLGYGWSISGLDVIQRSVRKGAPQYSGNDIFQWGNEELVFDGTYYHTQHENFARIQNIGGTGADSYWLITQKDGTEYRYGYNNDSRIEAVFADAADPRTGQIRHWALDQIKDTNDNYMTISYDEDTVNGDYYPDTITYTYNSGISVYRTVKFNWQIRTDVYEKWSEGAKERTDQRLANIEVNVGSNLLRKYVLSYSNSSSAEKSTLNQVKEYGMNGTSALLPTEFSYDNPVPGQKVAIDFGDSIGTFPGFTSFPCTQYGIPDGSGKCKLIDMNGDGLADEVYRYKHPNVPVAPRDGHYWVKFNNGSGFEDPVDFGDTIGSLPGYSTYGCGYYFPNAGEGGRCELRDMNGDGRPDEVYRYKHPFLGAPHDGHYWVRLNTGSGFAATPIDFGENIISELPSPSYPCGDYLPAAGGKCGFEDMNGDGLVDEVYRYYRSSSPISPWNGHYWVRLNTGSGFGDVIDFGESFSTVSGFTSYPITNYGIPSGSGKCKLMDMNGDGLPDEVYRYYRSSSPISPWNGHYWVRFNTGSGFAAPVDFGDNINSLPGFDRYKCADYFPNGGRCSLLDMNGDGLPDEIYRYKHPFLDAPYAGHYWVRLNTGSGFAATAVDFDESGLAGFTSYPCGDYLPTGSGTRCQFLDMNGDGLLDELYRYRSGSASAPYDGHYRVSTMIQPDDEHLRSSTLSTGGSLAYDYSPALQFDNTDLATGVPGLGNPMWVVTSLNRDDGLGSAYSINIGYKGGYRDPFLCEFRGFREVTVTDDYGQAITKYHQDDTYRSLVEWVERRTLGGALLSKETFTYQSITPVPGVVFPYLSSYTNDTYDGSSSFKRNRKDYLYDSYGNVEQIYDYGDYDVANDEVQTDTQFAYNTSTWVVNTPKYEKVSWRSGTSTWLTTRESWHYYDGLAYGSVDKGNETKVERWLDTTGDRISELKGYDAYGNVISSTDANGNTITYEYDTTYQTLLTKITYPITPVQTEEKEYDNLLRLWKETDRNGQITETQYDVFSRVTKIIRPLDNSTYPTIENQYFFDGIAPEYTLSKQQEQHGLAGTIDSYVFVDGFGRIIQTKEEAATTGNWITADSYYDGRGRETNTSVKYTTSQIETARDTNQKKTTKSYDAQSRITSISGPDGATTTTSYDRWVETTTNANGVQRIVTKDGYGRIKQIDENDGTTALTTTYKHNYATGELIEVTDPIGNDYTFTYDSLGRKILESDDDRGTWTYDYDDNGNLITQIDDKNQTVSYQYDTLNRKTKIDLPVGVDAFYAYDEAGHGDSVGRLTEVAFASNPTGPIASFSFEGNADDTTGVNDGTVFGATLVSGVSGQAYDFDGTNDYIAIQNLHFDTVGALDELTVTAWVKTSYSGGSWTANWAILDFDRSEYFNVFIRGDSGKIGFSTTDSAGTIKDSYGTTAINDGQWHLICVVYDGVDKIIYVDGVEDARHVDAHGKKNLGSGTTRYGIIGDGSEATSYNGSRNNIYYDGAIDELDLYTRALSATEIDQIYTGQSIDPDSSTEPELWAYKNFSYDARGRVISESLDIDGKLRLTQFAYDAADRMTTLTYPNTSGGAGEAVSLGYDDQGMLNHLAGTNTYLSNATYTPLAKINQYNYGNSTTVSYAYYDNASTYDPSAQTYHSYRLRSIGVTGGSVDLSLQYEHDKVGNVKKVTDLIDGDKSQEFDYDDLDRLTWANGNNLYGIKTYSFDKAGNILAKDGLTYTYGNGNRIASDGMYTFTHDANGNIVTRTDGTDTETFTYDGLNRLVHLSGPVTESYAYDDFETRVKKVNGSETTYYFNKYYEEVWLGGSSPDETISHYFADNHRIATRDAEGLKFKYSDHLGSATRIANISGTQTKAYWYTPYGADADETGTATVKYKYTDKEQDETGLYYYGARYYDAELGRFMAADSILPDPYDSQQLNRFAYVRNNPVKLVDPDGHKAINPISLILDGGALTIRSFVSIAEGGLGEPTNPGSYEGRSSVFRNTTTGPTLGDAIRANADGLIVTATALEAGAAVASLDPVGAATAGFELGEGIANLAEGQPVARASLTEKAVSAVGGSISGNLSRLGKIGDVVGAGADPILNIPSITDILEKTVDVATQEQQETLEFGSKQSTSATSNNPHNNRNSNDDDDEDDDD